MMEQKFPAQVIGKYEGTKGWIFKRPEYVVAFHILEGIRPTTEYAVPFHQYCSLNVGDTVTLTMYSNNGDSWYFSEEDVPPEFPLIGI